MILEESVVRVLESWPHTPSSPSLGTRKPPSVHDWWAPHLQQEFYLWRRPDKDGGNEAETLRKTVEETKAGGSSPPPSSQTLLSSAPETAGSSIPELPHWGCGSGFLCIPLPTHQHGHQLFFWMRTLVQGFDSPLGIFLTSTLEQWHAHKHTHKHTHRESACDKQIKLRSSHKTTTLSNSNRYNTYAYAYTYIFVSGKSVKFK